jgi:hypothetical protein
MPASGTTPLKVASIQALVSGLELGEFTDQIRHNASGSPVTNVVLTNGNFTLKQGATVIAVAVATVDNASGGSSRCTFLNVPLTNGLLYDIYLSYTSYTGPFFNWTSGTLSEIGNDTRLAWNPAEKGSNDYRVYTNIAPNAPTLTSPASGAVVGTQTPTLSWTFSDPDAGNTQSIYRVQMATDAGFTTNLLDTGNVSSASGSYIPPARSYGTWYWRAATADQDGAGGPFSTARTVIIDAPPGAPTPSFPLYGGYYNNRTQPVGWIFGDPDSGNTQTAFQVQVTSDSTFATITGYDTGKVVSSANSYAGVTLPSDGFWYYRIRTWDNSDVVGAYNVPGANWFFIDTVAPNAPTLTIGAKTATTVALSWTAASDPAPSSGIVDTRVYMRVFNGSAWVDIAGSPVVLAGAPTSYTYTGLKSGTVYHVIVQYRDNANNFGSYPELVFIINNSALFFGNEF